MNKEQVIKAFVDMMLENVGDACEELADPIGRNIPKNIQERADWFNSLSSKEKNHIKEVMNETGEHVMFGFLCAIDGVRKIFNDDVDIQLLFNGKKVVSEEKYDYDWHDLFKIIMDERKKDQKE